MSGGKTKSKSKTNNEIDPWSKQQYTQQQQNVRGLLGEAEAGAQYGGQLSVPGMSRPESDAYRFVTGYGPQSNQSQMPRITARGDGSFSMGGNGMEMLTNGPGQGQGQPQYLQSARGALDGYDAGGYQSVMDQQTPGIMQGIGDYQGVVDQARQDMTPRTFADFDANVYVNPHADAMIGSMTGDVEEAAARARANSDAGALANRAYGGSRHGVRDSMIDENMLDTIADQSARLRFDTWDRGADRFYQDVGNQQQAGSFLAGLGMDAASRGQADRFGIMDRSMGAVGAGNQDRLAQAGILADFDNQQIDRQLQVGGLERGIEQNALDRQYADYIRQRDEYWRQVQAEMGLLGSVPIITDGETSGTQKTNPGAFGWASLGAGLAGSMWGNG